MAVTRKFICHVEQSIHHGEHVHSVILRPQRPVPRFRPGQFLHLALDPYDSSGFWPESRVFSIASSPSDREHLRISYSVRGRFTARMEADLVEGRHVWVKMPYGHFMVDTTADVVLFAGGTGITAFTAFLEGLTMTSQAVNIAYGARNESLLIYRDLVRRCAARLPSLDVSYFIEQSTATGNPEHDGHERVHRGRMSVADVWPRILHPKEAAYYLSGPPAMLQTVTQDLRAHGVSAEAIKIDAWE